MNAVVVAMLLIAAAAAAGVPIVRWWADRRYSMRELPPLVIPFRAASRTRIDPFPIVPARARSRIEEEVRVEPVARADEAVRVEEFAPYEPDLQNELDEQEAAPNETVRFRRPVEEPVQLLPGRLEVLAGEPRQHEIRFVRIPGEPMQLILGRESGPSAQHVALKSSTVSRKHARFEFTNGHWAVANLSKTNPVVVNDKELSHADGARYLTDGDRLELGEVVLRFHAR
jgi:pSer/pThr/pTyr-binding forkhead associated (FHA) protein